MSISLHDLEKIRSQIDYIDDKIHDLLVHRAELVDVIALAKVKEGSKPAVALRPAREAQILRRLLARHSGLLPISVILHLWRSVLTAFCRLQSSFSIVYSTDKERDPDLVRDLIRYYYGSAVDVSRRVTEALVMHDMNQNEGVIGLFPAPFHGDKLPWWISLCHSVSPGHEKKPHVVGRLPFLQGDQPQFDKHPLYVVSSCPLEPSGDDLTLFVVITSSDVSRTTVQNLLLQTGYAAQTLAVHDDMAAGIRYHLIECGGCLLGQDWINFTLCQKEFFGDKAHDFRLLGVMPRPIDDLEMLRRDYLPSPTLSSVQEAL